MIHFLFQLNAPWFVLRQQLHQVILKKKCCIIQVHEFSKRLIHHFQFPNVLKANKKLKTSLKKAKLHDSTVCVLLLSQ